jgi:hypothetical protein
MITLSGRRGEAQSGWPGVSRTGTAGSRRKWLDARVCLRCPGGPDGSVARDSAVEGDRDGRAAARGSSAGLWPPGTATVRWWPAGPAGRWHALDQGRAS